MSVIYRDMYDVPTINDYNFSLFDKLTTAQRTRTDENGDEFTEYIAEINGQEVVVTYRNPDVEFRVKKLPAIVLYRHQMVYDVSRENNDSLQYVENWRDEANDEPLDIIDRDFPEPYNIFYSIEFYYKKEYDASFILQYILSKLPRRGMLEIKGEKYNIDLEEAPNLPDFGYKTFGKGEGKEENREQLLYKIEGELDLETTPTSNKVVLYHPEFNIHIKED